MKILIIEDERSLAQSISTYLTDEQYLCEFAVNMEEAYEKVDLYEYDCILLDLMLAGGDGLKVLEEIKAQNKQSGVIIISARDSVDDKITGLRLGADDYLAKPFHLSELAARIYSLIRRRNFGNDDVIHFDDVRINLQGKSVTVADQLVPLTRREYDLLLYFISNKNKVISKNALAEHLSGDMADALDNFNYIYVHIKNLKRKLTEAGCDNYLKTMYGTGYKWEM
ncbi:DNA-binding response regulator, OmpR family, contains REC and winged-helix (wHTH) domain [Chitinophaga jiangningensis]|uniref:DNA-binding response regulator, OmpR family, contains REC and winged-helix (WHTH) domain n=1 Tax=Chitinophaga jiangningensis TaxID=1419482 RepID=A0A1M7IQM2_9BACT|nr:response regulator transcription factor [Chitinophaga jiangningensis]SHM42888.1 DNA-binding response regulator, OmpR family, contains REC and winged-helix (wHTH) domain [Chitinophaga jiangningensis]